MNTLLVSITDFIQLAWERLTDGFAIKTVMAIFATIGIWLLGLKHVQVLGIFICLVFIDLLTKWVAIAYQMLLDMGASPENIRMTDKYWAIPAAFGKGLISSKHMRKPFGDKVLSYVLLTSAAWCFDFMAQPYTFAVTLVWTYLGGTELTSILENMRDGGNPLASKLLDIVNEKLDSILKRK